MSMCAAQFLGRFAPFVDPTSAMLRQVRSGLACAGTLHRRATAMAPEVAPSEITAGIVDPYGSN